MNCLVVADDFTGANAIGALLEQYGILSCVYTTTINHNTDLSQYEAVIFSTNSRGLTKQAAYESVYPIVAAFADKSLKLFANRIDSTLRGNIGSETDAFLDALGEDSIAIVVPCFPSAKRVNAGGYLLVDGVPLHLTAAAQDPKNPITTANTSDVIKRQSHYRCVNIYLEELEVSVEELTEKISKYKAQGNRILVFDACTSSHMLKIAEACIGTENKIVAVDPGMFTSIIAHKMLHKERIKQKKILLSIGSVNPVTEKQFKFLVENETVNCVYIEIEKILTSEDSKKKEMDRVVSYMLETQSQYELNCLIGSGIIPEKRVDLKKYENLKGKSIEELSNEINDVIACLTKRILDSDQSYTGIYVSGGDIALKVCEYLNANGMKQLKEIAPLAVLGKLISTDYSELNMITKGGMVGSENTIMECIKALKQI